MRKLAQVANETQFIQFITIVASRTSQLVNYGDKGKIAEPAKRPQKSGLCF